MFSSSKETWNVFIIIYTLKLFVNLIDKCNDYIKNNGDQDAKSL